MGKEITEESDENGRESSTSDTTSASSGTFNTQESGTDIPVVLATPTPNPEIIETRPAPSVYTAKPVPKVPKYNKTKRKF
jgi:hypothetical protein